VSMVRFRPWPPLPTRWFATGSGHRLRTIRCHWWLTRGLSARGWFYAGGGLAIWELGEPMSWLRN